MRFIRFILHFESGIVNDLLEISTAKTVSLLKENLEYNLSTLDKQE